MVTPQVGHHRAQRRNINDPVRKPVARAVDVAMRSATVSPFVDGMTDLSIVVTGPLRSEVAAVRPVAAVQTSAAGIDAGCRSDGRCGRSVQWRTVW